MVVKRNRETKLQYFNTFLSKKLKPFWDKYRPYSSYKNGHVNSKQIIEKKEMTIYKYTNKIVEKETWLVNNDQTAKTFNKHFTETVEKLNTF